MLVNIHPTMHSLQCVVLFDDVSFVAFHVKAYKKQSLFSNSVVFFTNVSVLPDEGFKSKNVLLIFF